MSGDPGTVVVRVLVESRVAPVIETSDMAAWVWCVGDPPVMGDTPGSFSFSAIRGGCFSLPIEYL